jgi:hypothetical protein
MNRLTAIGLASLVAYGLLIASKYTGVVSAARDDRSPSASPAIEVVGDASGVTAINAEPRQGTLALPAPVPRAQVSRLSGIALEFRTSRDLKAFADGLSSRAPDLTNDERYYLAKTLEECLFATTVNEDLAAYSAKQKRQFLASLPVGDPNFDKRVAAYEQADNTTRCLGFQNAKISQKDIDALYRAAAQLGDARAQARILTAELSKNMGKSAEPGQPVRNPGEDLSMLIGLLESNDPEALMYVGQFLSRNEVVQNLRFAPPTGPSPEIPESQALLGAFTLVACDVGQDCTRAGLNRDLLQACAFAGYCDPQSFEEFYQNFLASPWQYAQALRYRSMIRTAIDQRQWGIIGLSPTGKLAQSLPK